MPTRPMIIAFALALCACGALAQEPATGPAYDLHFRRDAWPAGTRLSIEERVTRRSSVLVKLPEGEPERRETVARYRFVGACTVAAVDALGPTRLEWTIGHLTRLVDGIESDLLPRGARVVAELADGEPRLLIDGAPLTAADPAMTAELREVADLILGLPPPGGAAPDELYQPRRPRRVGDSWPVNEVAAMRAAKATLATGKITSLGGDTTLLSADPDATPPRFQARHRLHLVATPDPAADPTMRVSQMSVNLESTVDYTFTPGALGAFHDQEIFVRRQRAQVQRDGLTLDLVTRDRTERDRHLRAE